MADQWAQPDQGTTVHAGLDGALVAGAMTTWPDPRYPWFRAAGAARSSLLHRLSSRLIQLRSWAFAVVCAEPLSVCGDVAEPVRTVSPDLGQQTWKACWVRRREAVSRPSVMCEPSHTPWECAPGVDAGSPQGCRRGIAAAPMTTVAEDLGRQGSTNSDQRWPMPTTPPQVIDIAWARGRGDDEAASVLRHLSRGPRSLGA